ncbi:response regulator transcription factor [Arcicella rigui]|uniref:Response regulator transcription factor n=1 Tax=Arcicella rigui TaxID=797020 RepID=A0ABU5Q5L1_9BACT|nr:response regulator transcription factor [Arcicella rigui]MEA5137892.1 response regulator transcription factor [Arcicella rigui]
MGIKIGIIEDDLILRKNIEAFFSITRDMEISFSVNSIENFLAISNSLAFGSYLVLVDIGLPGVSGIEGISVVRKTIPDAHIIMISGSSSEESIWQSVKAGANGYLLKPLSLDKLAEQIEIVKNNGALISPEVASILFSKISHSEEDKLTSLRKRLTKRELEVVDYLLKGMSYKEIANKLFISYSTVNDHVKKIYSKLEINSKGELLALFIN